MTVVVLGKSEGRAENWHGHVSALSVSPLYRKLGIATALMGRLEAASDDADTYFVDLFVRVSNTRAIEMYERMGYVVYRRVLEYYSEPDEDAFGMRRQPTSGCSCFVQTCGRRCGGIPRAGPRCP